MVSVFPSALRLSVTKGTPWNATLAVKDAEPEQKKPAGIGVWEKSTKVEPSPAVDQTSIPFWMARSAAKADVAKPEISNKIPRERTCIGKSPLKLSIHHLWVHSKAESAPASCEKKLVNSAVFLKRSLRCDRTSGGLRGCSSFSRFSPEWRRLPSRG